MRALRIKKIGIVVSILVGAVLLFTFSTHHTTVDFNTQVKPIFNKKCITCHGGVRRKAGFSLLFRSEAVANTESGKPAIIPGDPGRSELMRRITNKDPEERMPYKHDPLSENEIDILRRWIKEGAQWGDHWVYLPVKSVPVPGPTFSFTGLFKSNKAFPVNNDIDYFINEKLVAEKLNPAPQAAKSDLLRRVSLDLVGLPASPSLVSRFMRDTTEKAYEVLVDSLLASPHYGERWSAMWLDLARYADTKGYEKDGPREIWRYRDWLIKAFNKDQPYDKFLTDQIAGDLLPNPSDAQYIATAFHRNTMTNDEGGTDNEEFRTAAVVDRINTTWETLLGTSFGCVQCHSHPYDPFTHDEYYKFMGFFNNTRDEDTQADYPLLRHFKSQDSARLASLTGWLATNATKERAAEINEFIKTWEPAINSLTADKFVHSELTDTKWLVMRSHSEARLKNVNLQDKNQLIYRYTSGLKDGVWKIHLDSVKGPEIKTINVPVSKGWIVSSFEIPKGSGTHDIYFTYHNPNLKKPTDNGIVFDWFHFTQDFPGKDKPGYDTAKKYFWELVQANPSTTPVMMDNPADMHRRTFVFERGNWLVKGKEVEPGVPHALNPMPNGAPQNRLGLAMWLTSPQNPLTSRTMVNRLWEQLFGTGLVETLEDLGTQGALPTHPELHDYLAYKFMHEYKWSIKKLLKEIVMSAAYRRDAKTDKEGLEKDPYNRWYARASRVRLSAEQVRDQALAVSGLLSDKMYGRSVMPYQPYGVWLSPYSGETWEKSPGEDQYRRAVYIYWKRTAPYPSMMTFDGAAREVCTARRIRTNTPLQALVTLNDSVYLEAARHFAYRMKKEAGPELGSQIKKGYETVMYKPLEKSKLVIFEKLYTDALQGFKKNPERACEMIGVMDENNNPETAALVVVANAMLNLDEVITRN